MGALSGPVVRWGVWGAGRIAQDICRDLPLVPDVRLQAVAARRGEQARALATAFGAVRTHDSLAALLADTEVDVVYIATPNHCHVGDALACIAAGKAVLCEKPMALNLAEATTIVAAARAAGVFCMEALWSRFLPAIARARAIVRSGQLGRIRLLTGSFGYRVLPSPAVGLFQPAAGGGALLDRGVYLLSLAHHLMGAPDALQGTWLRGETGVDLQSSYLLDYPGAQANFTASLCTTLANTLTICGESATLTLHDPFYRAEAYRLRAVRGFDMAASVATAAGWRGRLKADPRLQGLHRRLQGWQQVADAARRQRLPFAGGGYQFQLAEVADCLRAGRTESAVMPLADTLEVTRQMDLLRAQWGLRFPQDA